MKSSGEDRGRQAGRAGADNRDVTRAKRLGSQTWIMPSRSCRTRCSAASASSGRQTCRLLQCDGFRILDTQAALPAAW